MGWFWKFQLSTAPGVKSVRKADALAERLRLVFANEKEVNNSTCEENRV